MFVCSFVFVLAKSYHPFVDEAVNPSNGFIQVTANNIRHEDKLAKVSADG